MNTIHSGSNEDYRELASAAVALAPTLLERAPRSPGARLVPDANIDDLKRSGLLRVIGARRNGDLETSMVTQLEVVAALAEGGPSTAWVAGVAHAHSWLIDHFPGQAQDDIYGDDPNLLVSAVINPRGRAERALGGYRSTGFWPTCRR